MNTTKNQSPQSISETPKEKQNEDNIQICKCKHPIDNHIEQIDGKVIAGECINCECKKYQSQQGVKQPLDNSNSSCVQDFSKGVSNETIHSEDNLADNLHKKQQDLEKEIEEYIIDCMNYGYSRKRITDDLLTVQGLRAFGDEDEALEIVRKQAERKGITFAKEEILKEIEKFLLQQDSLIYNFLAQRLSEDEFCDLRNQSIKELKEKIK